ncbi:YfcC family protein [Sedimentibacter saalensis]|uniref:YfcC family protein n=1 Tax=Sedimentibacter saalensis TaxID=130788 RepID=UPI00289BC5C9|nr:AbgT family transporter [Sedimentibacter saalensis]
MEATKRKKLSFPHEFIIVIVMAVLACILTYIIPAGEYEQIKSETGKMVINPDIFRYIENTPVSIWKIPMLLVKGFYDSSSLIFAILIFTGSMQIIMATGALRALTSTVIKKFSKRQTIAIAVIMFVIAVLSSPMGYNPFIAFVPVALLLSYQLGYDEMVGVAMITLAAAMGPNAGMLNPSTTGIGNQLAGLPIFNGIGFRLIGFFIFTAVTIVYVIRYANKVKADPTYSYVYGIKPSISSDADTIDEELTSRQKLVLVTVGIALIILVYGCTKLGWGFQQMSAFFLVLGALGGIVYGMRANDICMQFAEGSKLVVRAIILIAFARTVSIVLENGHILDTVVYSVSGWLNYFPKFLQAPGMLLIHTIINFFITSGSGQAVVTMPVMLPVAQIIGMSPETAILALNYGDGFTNIIFPHSAALMAFLVLSNVPYQKWLKFIWKLLLLWYLIGSVLLVIAQMIGY